MNTYIVSFCYGLDTPFKYLYNGEQLTSENHRILVKAKDEGSVLSGFRGTEPSVLSNINKIRLWT